MQVLWVYQVSDKVVGTCTGTIAEMWDTDITTYAVPATIISGMDIVSEF